MRQLQVTFIAVCFLSLESCIVHENPKCSGNVIAQYIFTENGGSWEDGQKRCREKMLPYPAVVANIDEMCVILNGMRDLNLRSIWIDFVDNISKPLFATNTSFLGIPLNFTSSISSSGKCLALHYNDLCNDFKWELHDCRDEHGRARYCMNESRLYWNASGTNNVFPDTPDDPLTFEKLLHDCARVDCDFNQLNNANFKVITLNGSNCANGTARFDHYSAECPTLPKNSIFAVAEISSNDSQIRKFIPENFQISKDTHTRRTVLQPIENKLVSISVISAQRSTATSTKITFTYRLDYRRLFERSSYKLSYDSNDEGLLRTTYRYHDHEPIGVFLNPSTKKFDTAGVDCRGKGEVTICISNHTTVFAVLLSVQTVKIPKALKVCAVVTQSVSVIFLFLTFVILLKVREKVRGERIPIQINLSLSLLLLHFWLLWGDIAIHYPTFCRAIAVMTYFFLLSSALWMMNEAHLLFFRTSKWAALATKRRKIVIASMCTGWGVPVIITVITTAVGFSRNTFMELSEFARSGDLESSDGISKGPIYDNCLLSTKNGMRLAAMVPVSSILTYNFIVAIWAVIFVHRKRIEGRKYMPADQGETNKNESHRKNLGDILHSLKVILLLLPILGIPWILTLLSNWGSETVKLVFLYASTLINGLQGLLIFIIYCIADTKVRETLKRSLVSLSAVWTSIADSLEKRQKSSTNTTGSGVISATSRQNEGRTVGTESK